MRALRHTSRRSCQGLANFGHRPLRRACRGLKVGEHLVADSFIQHDLDARPSFSPAEIPLRIFTHRSGFAAPFSFVGCSHNACYPRMRQSRRGSSFFEGLVATGDQFSRVVRTPASAGCPPLRLLCRFMESAAVAQVCRAPISHSASCASSPIRQMEAPHRLHKLRRTLRLHACAETVRHACALWSAECLQMLAVRLKTVRSEIKKIHSPRMSCDDFKSNEPINGIGQDKRAETDRRNLSGLRNQKAETASRYAMFNLFRSCLFDLCPDRPLSYKPIAPTLPMIQAPPWRI